MTLRLRKDTPSLRITKVVREIEKTFAVGRERPRFRLVHYSLQGNHAHFIVEAQDHAALGRGMMAIGSRLARAVNRVARRSGPVLADRFHHRALKTPREVHRALRYVLVNARHHVAKVRKAVTCVQPDPASSGRWFDGWKHGRVAEDEGDRARERSPVARARTWLLTTGWRRHGLLDPAAVPG